MLCFNFFNSKKRKRVKAAKTDKNNKNQEILIMQNVMRIIEKNRSKAVSDKWIKRGERRKIEKVWI